MLSPDVYRAAFAQGLGFDAYLAGAKPSELPGWRAAMDRTTLSAAQTSLVASFTRRLNVLCISGSWCGDCVQQGPILARIAAALPVAPGAGPQAPGIDLRWLERDAHLAFADHFKICGGHRVPTVIFLNEDFDFVALAGDRTLSRYRAVAARALGPSCPLPGAPVPEGELAATITDWLNEFERVALLLRLSAKLRQRHAD